MWAFWGQVISKDTVIGPFNYAQQNNYLKFWMDILEEKVAWKEAQLP